MEKLDAIEALLNISQTQSMSSELAGTSKAETHAKHPADANYELLRCGLEPVRASPDPGPGPGPDPGPDPEASSR